MVYLNLLAAGILAIGVLQTEFVQGLYSFYARKPFSWLASVQRSMLMGVVYVGVASFVVSPVPYASPTLVFSFTPHAYNLIIWPLAGLSILGKRFPAKYLVPALAMVYGLDELAWNGFVLLRFGWMPGVFNFDDPQGLLWWMPTPYWLGFFVLMTLFLAGGVYLLRPRFVNLRISVPIVLAFGLFWAFVMDFTLAGGPVAWSPTGLVMELCWQIVWWYFVFVSVRPRG